MLSPAGGGAGGSETGATVNEPSGAPDDVVPNVPAGISMTALSSEDFNITGVITPPALISLLISKVPVTVSVSAIITGAVVIVTGVTVVESVVTVGVVVAAGNVVVALVVVAAGVVFGTATVVVGVVVGMIVEVAVVVVGTAIVAVVVVVGVRVVVVVTTGIVVVVVLAAVPTIATELPAQVAAIGLASKSLITPLARLSEVVFMVVFSTLNCTVATVPAPEIPDGRPVRETNKR